MLFTVFVILLLVRVICACHVRVYFGKPPTLHTVDCAVTTLALLLGL
jgi:hypothetical protein